MYLQLKIKVIHTLVIPSEATKSASYLYMSSVADPECMGVVLLLRGGRFRGGGCIRNHSSAADREGARRVRPQLVVA